MDVLTTDEALRCEADHILDERGFLPLLHRFGTPRVHGSYSFQLMTWRDLDVYLVADDLSVPAFFTLGSDIATGLAPMRMRFRNEGELRRPDCHLVCIGECTYSPPSVTDGRLTCGRSRRTRIRRSRPRRQPLPGASHRAADGRSWN